ncbi:MAG: three-Cys-motif partner protein TcmP [Actinomycetota bacterium]
MQDSILQPDGLITPEVGAWSKDKYKLVSLYSSLFATGMKHKWEQRIFVDLYSGAGIARIKDNSELVMGTTLIGLTVKDPFDHYIFCDEDPNKIEALKLRAQRFAPHQHADFVVGDANEAVELIAGMIPSAGPDRRVLSLCIVDPYDIGIRFATIRKLAEKRLIDFLVLLAVYMDANRNYGNYMKASNTKVENFLGLPNWRQAWHEQEQRGVPFPDFLATQFSAQMGELGYLDQPLYKMKTVRSDEKNLRLYRLALFSRNLRAYEFWDEVLKYSTSQRKLFGE